MLLFHQKIRTNVVLLLFALLLNHQVSSLYLVAPKGSSCHWFMSSSLTAMDAPCPDEELSPSSRNIVRVLALHGSEGTGPDFAERIQPLFDSLAQEHGVEIQVTTVTAPFDKGEGKAWWIMPPGVRSFTATEYQGFEQSASLVTKALEKEEDGAPFDVVLGHSQGAILVSALLALERIPNHPSIGYILNGVAMPNPFKDKLESLDVKNDLSSSSSPRPPPRVLFVLGEDDKMNPIEIGDAVKTCMQQSGMDVSVCYHSGGHSVPVKDNKAVRTITTWIMDGLSS